MRSRPTVLSPRPRRLAVRAAALAVTTALLAPAAALASTPQQGRTAAAPTTASSSLGIGPDEALAQAKASGKPVQATAATTDSSTLTANPNGTLTLSQNTAPVRKRVHGQWQDLDTTLVRNADGTISPKVTTTALALSGGGSGKPLAQMKAADGALAVSLPAAFTLPAPALAGDTATYSDVLPGVDLTVAAQATGGFSEVLVVKDATAAANPALAELKLTTQATGVTVATDAAGNVTAKNKAGRALFSAPAPTMWDSTPAPSGTATVAEPKTGRLLEAHTGAPVASSTAQRGVAAHAAGLKAAYRDGAISLTPDSGVLRGKGIVYPVYIDPTFTPSGQQDALQAWTYVADEWPDTAYWGQSPDSKGHGPQFVGYTDWTADHFTARSFFQTGVNASVWNASVISSNISFWENWSASCTGTDVTLYSTGSISDQTTWHNQPSWDTNLGTATAAHGYPGCAADAVGFNITSLMQKAASQHWSSATFGLQAANESDDLGWKKFSNSATITTTFDHTPTTPAAAGLTTNPPTDCTAGSPTVLGKNDITLRAPVSDPDGTISPLTAQFVLKNMASGATYPQNINSTSGTTASAFYSHTSTSGPFQALTAKTQFAWYVSVSDQYLTSSPSATCHFYYDPTVPGAPTVAPVTTGTSSCPDLGTSNASNPLCVVGTSAGFTITDTNTTTGSPASYLYQLNDGAPVSVLASTTSPYTATISLKPTRQTNSLVVTAVSAGSNIGDSFVYRFLASAPATATGDDMTGDGKADLLTVGGKNRLPAGLWLANGTGTGQLNNAGTNQANAIAANIGINGNGVATTQTPGSFTGTQAITGHFFTGNGFNDVLDYTFDQAAGYASAEILRGQGDGSTLNPVDALPVFDATGTFSLSNGASTPRSFATSIATGGSLYNTVNSSATTGYPDLLLVMGGKLYLEAATKVTAHYTGAGQATDLADYNPYCLAQNAANSNTLCSTDWSGWTITSTLVSGLPAIFARDTNPTSASAGQLWYLNSASLNTLASDAMGGNTDTALASGFKSAASGWDASSVPVLQAADINNDGNPDLFTVSSSGAVTPYIADATGNLTPKTAQTLTTAAHNWPLNDYSTTSHTAADTTSGSPLALTGTSGVIASSGGMFTSDVTLGGGNYLQASGKALDLTNSFTVSAWAFPTTYGGTVLSQDGSANSGILITPTSAGWQFSLNTGSGTAATFDTITAGTVQLGSWAHLTATYDKTTAVMSLYVDDIFVYQISHAAPSTGATSYFQIGDDFKSGTRGDYFTGRIANVQTWTGAALPPARPYTPASYHQAITPTRILDTRNSGSIGYTDGTATAGTSTVHGGSVTSLRIAGDTVTPSTSGAPNHIPDSVTAVAIDVTVANETGYGYVTAYADGTQRPLTSSTNFAPNTPATGYQIVPVGNDGKIDLFTHGYGTDTVALVVDITGYFTSDSTLTGNQTYTPLTTATRTLDTRSSTANTSLTSTGTVPAGTSFTLKVAGVNNVPANATAVAVNLTAAGESGNGYLQAYATGAAPTTMTSLTYNTTSALASMSADTPIGTGGTITIANYLSSTAILVDIAGYYTTDNTGQAYHAVNPVRLVDTRNGTGTGKAAAPLTSAQTWTMPNTDTQQVTTAATPTLATVLTVTNTGSPGYLTAYPTGGAVPTASNLNWNTGNTLANLALTPTNTNGQINFYNFAYGTTDLVIDCSGYFSK
ncbi:LamG domain-containing protein [Kitasatospora sp. NPDC002227]|uniref:beta strand repeat-containing protein n=1 Tax=Kitasatospora sp. NPDC002227 TaxID=3154773 RepID=UPI00332DF279